MKATNYKLSIHELAQLAIICALMVGIKEIMNFLPNVHPVMLFIILAVKVYGYKSIYSTICFVVIESILYGLNLWTICYIYIWPIYTIVAIMFRNNDSKLFWAVYSAICGLIFGLLSSLTALVISGFESAIAYWVSGISFDIVHCVSNFIIVYFLFSPMYSIMNKLKAKYN